MIVKYDQKTMKALLETWLRYRSKQVTVSIKDRVLFLMYKCKIRFLRMIGVIPSRFGHVITMDNGQEKEWFEFHPLRTVDGVELKVSFSGGNVRIIQEGAAGDGWHSSCAQVYFDFDTETNGCVFVGDAIDQLISILKLAKQEERNDRIDSFTNKRRIVG